MPSHRVVRSRSGTYRFRPRRLHLSIEPRNLRKHVGGEQPNGVALTPLQTVQKYFDIAGRAFDNTYSITEGEPIGKIPRPLGYSGHPSS